MSPLARLRSLLAKPYGVVDPVTAQQLVAEGAVLLDVRERWEWQAGHAPRARHIPLAQLGTRVGELPQGRAVVVVCRSGNRSARAAALLARVHGRETLNLAGGMRGWASAGLPVVASGGRPGAVS